MASSSRVERRVNMEELVSLFKVSDFHKSLNRGSYLVADHLRRGQGRDISRVCVYVSRVEELGKWQTVLASSIDVWSHIIQLAE